jgi:hypothetical protein
MEHDCAFMASPECVSLDDDSDTDDVTSSMASAVMDDEHNINATRHSSHANSCQGKLVM